MPTDRAIGTTIAGGTSWYSSSAVVCCRPHRASSLTATVGSALPKARGTNRSGPVAQPRPQHHDCPPASPGWNTRSRSARRPTRAGCGSTRCPLHSLTARLGAHLSVGELFVAPILQRADLDFVTSAAWPRHLRTMHAGLGERRDAAAQAGCPLLARRSLPSTQGRSVSLDRAPRRLRRRAVRARGGARGDRHQPWSSLGPRRSTRVIRASELRGRRGPTPLLMDTEARDRSSEMSPSEEISAPADSRNAVKPG